MSERLDTLARRLIDKRAEYDAAHKVKVKAEEAKEEAERALFDALKAANQKSSGTLELGGDYGDLQFTRMSKVSASVFDAEQALAWFEEHHEEAAIEKKIRRKTLNDMTREYLEHGTAMPPGVEPRETPFIRVTKRG